MFRIMGDTRKSYFCPVCQKGVRKAKVLLRFQGFNGEEALLGCPKCATEVMEMTEYIHLQLARIGRARAK